MTARIFITGTDTDVGKTYVTRGILRALVDAGKRVVPVKPVESGVLTAGGQMAPLDGLALRRAARSPLAVDQICAYMFPDPVSPHLAAARVGKHIEAAPILALLASREKEADIVIAEGAGGLLVPLSDTLLYADLIAESGYGLVIVALNKLGTINATLLTIEAARTRGIPVLGVVLNQTPAAEFGNGEAIAHHGKVPVIGAFPTCANDDDALGQMAKVHLDLEIFQ